MERGHAPKDRRWPLEPETVSPEAPRGTAAPRTPRIYPAETKFEFHSSKTAKHSWVFLNWDIIGIEHHIHFGGTT